MPMSIPFPTAPLDDLWGTAVVGAHPVPFPVARTIGRATRNTHLHLLDGDGASLCEGFTEEELERLPLAWAEVVEVARCRACDVIGCPPMTTGGPGRRVPGPEHR